MGQSGGGGSADDTFAIKSEKIAVLTVNDVIVNKRMVDVQVPKYITVEQIKYNDIVQDQIKYNTIEQETIKYNVKQESTIKYTPTEVETVKYVPKEVEIEIPVLVDTPYERPIIKNKDYTIATFKDVDALRGLMELIPKLVQSVADLTTKLDSLREYKLVEEIVKTNRVSFVNVDVDRVVWKDVEHSKCKRCNKEVDNDA